MKQLRLAMPIGDAAGIGPEIVLKFLMACPSDVAPIVIGDPSPLVDHAQACGIDCQIASDQISFPDGRFFPLKSLGHLGEGDWRFGEVGERAGAACYRYAQKGVRFAMDGLVDAVIAAPHTEAAVNSAGIQFDGYPGLVADETETPRDSVF